MSVEIWTGVLYSAQDGSFPGPIMCNHLKNVCCLKTLDGVGHGGGVFCLTRSTTVEIPIRTRIVIQNASRMTAFRIVSSGALPPSLSSSGLFAHASPRSATRTARATVLVTAIETTPKSSLHQHLARRGRGLSAGSLAVVVDGWVLTLAPAVLD